jgi:hypothetical protein
MSKADGPVNELSIEIPKLYLLPQLWEDANTVEDYIAVADIVKSALREMGDTLTEIRDELKKDFIDDLETPEDPQGQERGELCQD